MVERAVGYAREKGKRGAWKEEGENHLLPVKFAQRSIAQQIDHSHCSLLNEIYCISFFPARCNTRRPVNDVGSTSISLHLSDAVNVENLDELNLRHLEWKSRSLVNFDTTPYAACNACNEVTYEPKKRGLE